MSLAGMTVKTGDIIFALFQKGKLKQKSIFMTQKYLRVETEREREHTMRSLYRETDIESLVSDLGSHPCLQYPS